MTSSTAVSLADIEAAAERLRGVVRDLPVHSARWLSDLVGGPAFLATENLQRAGSFKIRGAYNRLSQLTDAERAVGVVAASAGNHAQGVALAAGMLGIHATIFMPRSASMPKVIATQDYGAEVRFHGATLDEAIAEARQFADQTGALFISPFDHADIVAGQGTLGLEILQQCPDVKTVVVCTGGGGLLAGVALAVKSLRPDVRVIGAQAAGAAAYPPSLLAGHPVPLTRMRTMADGIAVGRPGDVPFALIQKYVDDIRVVSEDSLARAQLKLLERSKLVVEPGGAAAVAAIMDDPASFDPTVVAVLSGGNVDPLVMMRVIRHGLTAGGRFTQLTVHMPDRPGSLAGLLNEIASMDANVVDVSHLRTNPRLAVDEVEITIDLETRGQEHREQLLATLRDHGYRIVSAQ
ncbi:MAG: threonine ammonia-lyase [Actinomycetales bacterium mxb001]|nr:MAG: threonine ammonia-lyase [Actinomycetales bacterium mxb001]